MEEAVQLVTERFGPIALSSPHFTFEHTRYYARTMGEGLQKQFLVCAGLQSAEMLVEAKIRANQIEAEVAARGRWPVERPLNLDPGYLESGKLVLASTKDHAHRIYLGQGIFAEVTLHFRDNHWRTWPWTYADYATDQARDFFLSARRYYRSLLVPPQTRSR